MRSILIISALSAVTLAPGVSAQAWLDLTIGPGGIADGVFDELGTCYGLEPVEMHVNSDGNIIITGEVVPWCNMPLSNQHFFAARFFPGWNGRLYIR